jgi:DNA-binding MarR family transcriptional regulator
LSSIAQPTINKSWYLAAGEDDHPGIAQTGLAQRMRMDHATTMAIVNRLESQRYLVRRKSKTDGRKQALNLTNPGRNALMRAKGAIRQHEDWLKARFTQKEVAKLIELLTRIHE